MDPSDLVNRFQFHPAHDDQPDKYAQLRAKFLETALLINELVPEGREKSLAITNLEQTGFWANAGIARNS